MSALENDLVPDVAGPITGYRFWATHGSDFLFSTGVSFRWPSGPVTASCYPTPLPRGRPCHLTPSAPRYAANHAFGDGCGFYAYNSLEALFASLGAASPIDVALQRWVIGRVEMWGRVYPYELGYRASHAEITGIYLPAISVAGFENEVLTLAGTYRARMLSDDILQLYKAWQGDQPSNVRRDKPSDVRCLLWGGPYHGTAIAVRSGITHLTVVLPLPTVTVTQLSGLGGLRLRTGTYVRRGFTCLGHAWDVLLWKDDIWENASAFVNVVDLLLWLAGAPPRDLS